ncbi:hypothetical protein LTR37_003722 [Vermiconidia calcicola]|uniref:Uncharacterized protein n=1 Tax=Vermiconidia calcicola TaxID=1690605 RepID=A0ACC3NPD2_9PEZI|nr:hypothetical protein LTR37_003722 [Vermiconidia calcicola]
MADNTSPSRSATGRCMFWKLPPEVRVMIFDLAYGEAREVKVLLRSNWKTAEKARRIESGGNLAPRSFPMSVFSPMLVDKEYLEEAAQAYMKEKTFAFLSPAFIGEAVNNGWPTEGRLTRLMSSVKVRFLSWEAHKVLRQLPKLRALELGLQQSDFEGKDDKCPELDEYTDLDFLKMDCIADLLKVRGFRTITVKSGVLFPRKTQEQAARWSRLLWQVERFLSDLMTRPLGVDRRVTKEHGRNGRSSSKRNASAESKDATSKTTKSHGDDPLTAADIPNSEAAFARLVSTRPKALFEWMRDAAQCLESGRG